MSITILGIESSCDDTAASIVRDGYVLSNIISNQNIHEEFGGVIPELASRAHQQNIIPVVDQAIKKAMIKKSEINAIAFTRGPGLLGSLLVGTSFAKGFALSQNIPLIEVNHLQAHVLAHFIKLSGKKTRFPKFPFLCLLVSGGHTQLIIVQDYLVIKTIGRTIDDAAGEAFDKCAKIIGLPYPGGPHIDKFAEKGDSKAFIFTKPKIKNLDFSFSGLKTAFLYFIRDQVKHNPDFINKNLVNICASIQQTIIEILLEKLIKATEITGIKEIGIAGGVSANSLLRKKVLIESQKRNWKIFIPEFRFTTDNAAMIAITGYYKYRQGQFVGQGISPVARLTI
jgi:N6-L-threonylcarbamoyladenine synthase